MTNIFVCLFASDGFKRQQELQRREFLGIGVPQEKIFCSGPEELGDDFFNDIPYASEENRFGDYSFKPYIFSKLMKRVPDGSVLLYLDANDRPKPGICEYADALMQRSADINIVSPLTNYANSRHSSWYHRSRSPLALTFLSSVKYQPETGCVVLRSGAESHALMKTWYSMTLMHSYQIQKKVDSESRPDQETLFQLAQLNNSVKFESWWRHRLFGHGLRKYVDWEYFRNVD